MKKLSLPMLPLLGLLFLLQSCVKNDPFPQQKPSDDKLLLSKVTGHLQSEFYWGINAYAYDQKSDFLTTYAYESKQKGWDHYKQLNKIGYINTGSWDFTYNNSIPFKTTDNSFPGQDLGYWKYDFNNKGQIEKTGLSFKAAEQPSEYEFYTYDNHNNLVSVIYGRYIDTPYFKIVYEYDHENNLTTFTYYYPIAYAVDASARSANERMNLYSSTLKAPGGIAVNKLQQIRHQLSEKNARQTPMMSARGSNGAPDANVVYAFLLSAKITSDHMNNPYNQQGRLLFYQTNRLYVFRLNDFYLSLLKHNPVKVEYMVDNGDGTFLNAEQLFTYTYNKERYPVAIHEIMDDPNFFDHGSYIQDFAVEYTTNN